LSVLGDKGVDNNIPSFKEDIGRSKKTVNTFPHYIRNVFRGPLKEGEKLGRVGPVKVISARGVIRRGENLTGTWPESRKRGGRGVATEDGACRHECFEEALVNRTEEECGGRGFCYDPEFARIVECLKLTRIRWELK
jgi:hypothetical protein